jgi:alpha,alpha-trehalose phosphorylase
MSEILARRGLDAGALLADETLFHLANGYIGVRGNFEEGYPEGYGTVRGTYLNGFHDIHAIRHPELLFGFPETGERIVNVTDAQTLRLFADGERMVLSPAATEDFERSLDAESGVALRRFTWRSRRGARLRVEIRRLVSFATRELFAVEYRLTCLGPAADILLEAVLDGDVANYQDTGDPRVSNVAFKPLAVRSVEAGLGEGGAAQLYVESRAGGNGLDLACLSEIALSGGSGKAGCAIEVRVAARSASCLISGRLAEGEDLVLTRKNVYVDTRHHEALRRDAGLVLGGLEMDGFRELEEKQRAFLADFWEGSEVRVGGGEGVTEGLRFNLFQLLQCGPVDGLSSVPAKGLSGEGYEGHYFWDTEIYMLPFYTYTNPRIARGILAYRHSILGAARERARAMGHKRGAAFPWRTIAGRECSAYYPSGSAQYHINADIAYAVWRYFEATDDLTFMVDYGAELLIETARIWIELGHFLGGDFRIDAVTGPDEYTCLVNNNYYTNAMAKYNLENASRVEELLARRDPAALARVAARTGLGADEAQGWRRAAAAMYLPHDEALGISAQDDSFLKKARWDFEGTPEENYPLLLHYHHLTICRYQVCKQADAVLAHLLLPGLVGGETAEKTYNYYEALTTHDSSLSYAAFSAMAARLGDAEKAYRYFAKTARLDIDDSHGNTKDGLHAANIGGTWFALVLGFGGFDPGGERPSLAPILPGTWDSLGFRLLFRGRSLEVGARREAGGATKVELALLHGEPLEIVVYGRAYLLEGRLRVERG